MAGAAGQGAPVRRDDADAALSRANAAVGARRLSAHHEQFAQLLEQREREADFGKVVPRPPGGGRRVGATGDVKDDVRLEQALRVKDGRLARRDVVAILHVRVRVLRQRPDS